MGWNWLEGEDEDNKHVVTDKGNNDNEYYKAEAIMVNLLGCSYDKEDKDDDDDNGVEDPLTNVKDIDDKGCKGCM